MKASMRSQSNHLGMARLSVGSFAESVLSLSHDEDDSLESCPVSSNSSVTSDSSSDEDSFRHCNSRSKGSFADSVGKPATHQGGFFPRIVSTSTCIASERNSDNDSLPSGKRQGSFKLKSLRRRALRMLSSNTVDRPKEQAEASSNIADLATSQHDQDASADHKEQEQPVDEDAECDIDSGSSDSESSGDAHSSSRRTKRKSYSGISLLPVVMEEDENNTDMEGVACTPFDDDNSRAGSCMSSSLSSMDTSSVSQLLKEGHEDKTADGTAVTPLTQSMSSWDSYSFNGKHLRNHVSWDSVSCISKDVENELQARLKVIFTLKDVILEQRNQLKKTNTENILFKKRLQRTSQIIRVLQERHQAQTTCIAELRNERDTYATEVVSLHDKLEASRNEVNQLKLQLAQQQGAHKNEWFKSLKSTTRIEKLLPDQVTEWRKMKNELSSYGNSSDSGHDDTSNESNRSLERDCLMASEVGAESCDDGLTKQSSLQSYFRISRRKQQFLRCP